MFQKPKSLIVGFAGALLAALSAQAQGTFQNLDFEQANPVIVVGGYNYPYVVTAADALPDWTVTVGGAQQTQIIDNYLLYSPAVTLWGGLSPAMEPSFTIIDGNYSVALSGNPYGGAASISQSGLIPSGTQFLLFDGASFGGQLNVLVGSQIVPFVAVESGPNNSILYGANISEWAGNTEQITFLAPAAEPSAPIGWIIDDISFSQTAVPEPSIVALSATGTLLFGLRKWFARC